MHTLTRTTRHLSFALALLAPLLALCVGAAARFSAQATAEHKPPPAQKLLGMLVYPGVDVIDFAGPYEVLSSVFFERKKVFDVVTVGLTSDTIRTNPGFEGLKLAPDYTIDNCPKLDLLLIPGGETGSVSDNPKAMEWIARTVKDAECVMSVCNGAFILAQGGHLKNQSATTFFYFIDGLKQSEPTCTPVHDRRFVDNGKIITAAGLSSGIDAALHLVERYTNRFEAEQKALGLEYNWQPDSEWTRGNLADRHYISMVGAGFPIPEGSYSDWRTVENDGSVQHWTKRWTFSSALQRADLLKYLELKLIAAWARGPVQGDTSVWEFKDDEQRPWKAALTLTTVGDQKWTMTLEIDAQKR